MREQKPHWIPNLSSGLIYSYILAIPLSSSFLPSPLISPLPSSSLSFSFSTSFPHSTRTTAKYNDLKGERRTMMTVSPLWFLSFCQVFLSLCYEMRQVAVFANTFATFVRAWLIVPMAHILLSRFLHASYEVVFLSEAGNYVSEVPTTFK